MHTLKSAKGDLGELLLALLGSFTPSVYIIKITIIFRYLSSAVIIALMLVGPSKYLKKILNMKLNRVKNPNWPEAKQLAIYKCGRGFELEATMPNPTGGQSGT